VRLGRLGGSAVESAIRAAARRMGVPLSVLPGDHDRTRVGDTTLPLDPPSWWIEAALLRWLAPSHFLFLCVANSARSQMAEGIGRSLAPAPVRVSSAGSAPTSVRPEAVRVLAEEGIDISAQRSTGIDDVDPSVDAVVTLCAEEVCPVWLGKAWRVHWGLADPATIEGDGATRLEAFRAVRDELTERLTVIFGPSTDP
jgi:arsenate reductase